MQKPYDSETFEYLIMESKLIVTQVSIAGQAGTGNEAISTDLCRWKHAVQGKFHSLHEMLLALMYSQWWLSFTKRKFMGKSL